MSLWSHAEAAEATGGRATAPWTANGVSIDTRTLARGDLFVALTAARDGHDFVADALAKGAAAALVSRIPEGVAKDAPLLLVDDVQTALEDLGRAARTRSKARVVAVTGSVGKTSTKEMLRKVLSGQGKTHAAEASYNNHWGVPLTLARMPADSDFAVIEIGMNNPGEIAPLARMARPHVAMVTTVAPAHLAAFANVAGIAREKASICEGLEPGGVAVINGDLAVSSILKDIAERHAAQVVTFGEERSNHHRLISADVRRDVTVATGRAWRAPLLYKVAAAGRHFAQNALGVLAVAWALKLDRAIAITDLGHWQPGAGRGAREKVALDPADTRMTFELIDDSYNANPASVGASLDVLAGAQTRDDVGRVSSGRRIAVLGDMKELGETGPDLHRALAARPSMAEIDRVHCVGPLMRELHRALPDAKRGHWTKTSAEMAQKIRGTLDAGDVVLVKGSLSMALAQVVDAIRNMGEARVES